MNGWFYGTFADLAANDTGDDHGWVVGVKAGDLSQQVFFPLTINVCGGGGWGPGGAAATADGSLFVATANAKLSGPGDNNDLNSGGFYAGTVPNNLLDNNPNTPNPQARFTISPPDHGDYFEAVVRLSVDQASGALKAVDWYMPHDAYAMNYQDQDLGGSSPLLLSGNGRELLVVTAKDGSLFVLDARDLGGYGHSLWRSAIFSAESKSSPAYYVFEEGVDVVFYVFTNSQGTPVLASVEIRIAANGAVEVAGVNWQATDGQGNPLDPAKCGDACGSPTVAADNTNPATAIVWMATGGDDPQGGTKIREQLLGFEAISGKQLFASGPIDDVDPNNHALHYPPVTCAGKSLLVGTNNGFVCFGL